MRQQRPQQIGEVVGAEAAGDGQPQIRRGGCDGRQVLRRPRGVQRAAQALGGVHQHIRNDAGVPGAALGQRLGIAVHRRHRFPAGLQYDAAGLAAFPIFGQFRRIRPGRTPSGINLDAMAIGAADCSCTGQSVGQPDAAQTGDGRRAVMHQVEAARVGGENAGDGVRRRAAGRRAAGPAGQQGVA